MNGVFGQILHVTFKAYSDCLGYSAMNKAFEATGTFVKTLFCLAMLRLLQLSGVLLPRWGMWAKQKFFILTAYHELKRHRLIATLHLDQINSRLLKIQQEAVLLNVSEITQWHVIQLDLNKIREAGVDIDGIMRGAKLNARDLEVIANAILDSTPSTLKYSRSAMFSDLQRLLCQTLQTDNCKLV